MYDCKTQKCTCILKAKQNSTAAYSKFYKFSKHFLLLLHTWWSRYGGIVTSNTRKDGAKLKNPKHKMLNNILKKRKKRKRWWIMITWWRYHTKTIIFHLQMQADKLFENERISLYFFQKSKIDWTFHKHIHIYLKT